LIKRRLYVKNRKKGREKKIRKFPGKLNFHRHFRDGTVNEIEQFFPPIRLGTGLEVERRGR